MYVSFIFLINIINNNNCNKYKWYSGQLVIILIPVLAGSSSSILKGSSGRDNSGRDIKRQSPIRKLPPPSFIL